MTTTVRIQHARALGFCAAGCRRFFARHGLDWARFVRDGLPAEDLRATGDALASRLVEKAEAERPS